MPKILVAWLSQLTQEILTFYSASVNSQFTFKGFLQFTFNGFLRLNS